MSGKDIFAPFLEPLGSKDKNPQSREWVFIGQFKISEKKFMHL